MAANAILSARQVKGRIFHEIQNIDDGWLTPVAGPVLSTDQNQEQYAGVGAAPPMTVWAGSRKSADYRTISYTITNEKFETSVRIPVDDLFTDKTDRLRPYISSLSSRYNEHWIQLVGTLINNGATAGNNSYDGVTFFNATHAEGSSGNQSNLLTSAAAGATVTVSEAEAAITQSIAAIVGFKDDQGRPINRDKRNFVIVVPIAIMWTAAAAIKAPLIGDANGAARSNIFAAWANFSITLVPSPDVANVSKGAFFTFAADGRAFIRQEDPNRFKISSLEDGSDVAFREDMYEYGIKAVRNAGYGAWQSACRYVYT